MQLIISFGVGLFIGIITTALILRNNRKVSDKLEATKK